jgi:porin
LSVCRFFFLFFLITELFARGEPLPLETTTEVDLSSKMMTGDWGGGRTVLEERGIFIRFAYTTDMVGNPVGGKNQGFSYAGSYGLGLDIDFEKACGVTGLLIHSDLVWRTGTSLSREHIGNQFPVQQLFGSQTVKLNELYVKETLFEGAFVFKAGRLNAGNDFLQNPLYYFFVSNAFCGNPISVFFNTDFSAYPNATWGVYLSGQPVSWMIMKGAVYNANNYISDNKYHGCNFTFKSTNGVIWITEWDFLNTSSYSGNYKFGFFYQIGGNDPCLYVQIDQMIAPGLSPFIALVFQPKSRNLFPFFTTAGFVYKGPFTSRPRDTLTLGVAYGRYSSDLTTQSFECVLELNYWIQANGWLTIVPDLQYIIKPRGLGTIPNSLVIGAQIGFIL